MKLVILAAGLGTRLWPLTESRPKPLVEIMGKPFLYYLLTNVVKAGYDDIVLIVGYKKEMIEKFLKDYGFEAKLIVQEKYDEGTAKALYLAKNFVGEEDFVLLMGDNFYSFKDLKNINKDDKYNYIACCRSVSPEKYGVLSIEDEFVKNIIEKPENPPTNIINVGLYKLKSTIFQEIDKIDKSKRGEYEIIDALNSLAERRKLKHYEIKDHWFDFGYPWDLFKLNEFLINTTKEYRNGTISKKADINDKVIVENGAVIKSGVCIDGPVYIGHGCVIGPNCYIRPYTSLGKSVHVGAASEVKNSIIMDNTNVPHHNYVGDSIIGMNCNLGSGTKVANLRLDGKNVNVIVKEKKVDSGRRKLGIVMGDNVKTGLNASLMPGIIIGNNCFIGPNVLLTENLESGKAVFLKQETKVADNKFA